MATEMADWLSIKRVVSEPRRSFSFFVRRSSFFPFIAFPFLFPLNHVTGARLERCRSSHQERVFCFPFSSRLTPTLSHHAVTPQIPLRADYAFISFYGFADLRFSLLLCLSLFPCLLVVYSSFLFVRHIIRFVSMRPFEWYVRLDETFSIYFSIPFLLHFSSYPSNFRYLPSSFSPLRRL